MLKSTSNFVLRSRSILFGAGTLRNLPQTENHGFCLRCISNSSDQPSFVVSYLKNSFGFSPKTAKLVSRHVNFVAPEKPDSIIQFFKDYGFTQAQISILVRRHPRVLSSDIEKTLMPKLEFFRSKGVSASQISELLSVFPYVFRSNLDKQIIPAFDFLRNLFQSDEKAIRAFKRCGHILSYDVANYVGGKICILQEHGVPYSIILKWILYYPRAFLVKPESFRDSVQKVKEMKMDPTSSKFVVAVFILGIMSKLTWERKVYYYKMWGWSEEDVFEAFRRCPFIMTVSEDKINAVMDFFINKMGMEPSFIAKRPVLLSLSLKKRLIPRGSIIPVLFSKGLVKKDVNLSTFFLVQEEKFLKNFVMRYKDESSELLRLYKEKLDLSRQNDV